jgi:hypothetical protein
VRPLAELLERSEVITHPFIIGELACGNLKNRDEILRLLAALPSVTVATDEETLLLIERERLMGKGIGYIDVHLLASAALTPGARIWTRDRRFAAVVRELGLELNVA